MSPSCDLWETVGNAAVSRCRVSCTSATIGLSDRTSLSCDAVIQGMSRGFEHLICLTISLCEALLIDLFRCNIQKPIIFITGLDPAGYLHLEIILNEQSNEPLSRLNLIFYQCLRIHGNTPSGSSVMASNNSL